MQKLTIRELLDTNRAALDGKGGLDPPGHDAGRSRRQAGR